MSIDTLFLYRYKVLILGIVTGIATKDDKKTTVFIYDTSVSLL